MSIKQYLSQRKSIIERALLSFLPKAQKYTEKLHDAAKYSLMSGGKRIRPILVLAACEAVSGSYKIAIPMAVAIEMIHTYTLIHDDLPAMDDDDLRRGKPTCHKAFGEDIAILAGDMLNTLAFQIIAEEYGRRSAPVISEISRSLGINGVVGGQAADLRSPRRNSSITELQFISSRKTACLFMASMKCGAMIGAANRKELSALTEFGRHLGLAFQIIDDILDYRKETKKSYPVLLGLSRSKEEAKKEIGLAINALPRSCSYDKLREIALYLTERKE